MLVIAFLLGLAAGSLMVHAIFRRAKVGTLRVDTSDPEDGPYMFLEIDKGVGDITSKRYVLLKVDLQSYLSRK